MAGRVRSFIGVIVRFLTLISLGLWRDADVFVSNQFKTFLVIFKTKSSMLSNERNKKKLSTFCKRFALNSEKNIILVLLSLISL